MAISKGCCCYDSIYADCLWYNFLNYGRAGLSLGKVKRFVP